MLDWGTRPKIAATAVIKTIKAIKPTPRLQRNQISRGNEE